MRFYFSVLLFFSVSILYAQEGDILQAQININTKQKTIQSILDDIEQDANITFSFNNTVINSDSVIGTFVFNGSIEGFLKKILPPNISYVLNSNNIILYRNSKIEEKTIQNNKDPLIVPGQKEELLPTISQVEKKGQTAPMQSPAIPKKEANLETLKRIESTGAIMNTPLVSFEATKMELKIQSPAIGIYEKIKTRKQSSSRKKGVKYSIGLSYQILNEKTQYNNIALEGDTEWFGEITFSPEKSSTSPRIGVNTIVAINNYTITSGIAFKKSSESYHYFLTKDSSSFYPYLPDSMQTVENTYRYLSIPLMVGYQKQLNAKFFVSGELGAWFNILYSRSGRYIDLIEYTAKDIKEAPLNIVTPDLASSISVGCHVLKKVCITLSASYMYPLSPMFKNDYPLIRKKSATGYSFGLIYKFNP